MLGLSQQNGKARPPHAEHEEDELFGQNSHEATSIIIYYYG
jgi:hypothetical protein